MAWRARLDAPGAFHHVWARGLNRQVIFIDDADRSDFVARLRDVALQGRVRVLAWALLPNHLHLLSQSGDLGVSAALQTVLGGYASHFNRRHGRSGHLFQNRFGSALVDADGYLRELLRYVHLNPVRAGLVPDLDVLDSYQWSGHAALVGTTPNDWQDVTAVLSLFGITTERARRQYRQFVATAIESPTAWKPPSTGARRQPHGIQPVDELKRGRERWSFDEHLVGSDQFLRRVLQEAGNCQSWKARLAAHPEAGIDALEAAWCRATDIPLADVRDGSKNRRTVAARAVLSWVGVRLLRLSPTLLAQRFQVSPRSLERSVTAGRASAAKLAISIDQLIEDAIQVAGRGSE